MNVSQPGYGRDMTGMDETRTWDMNDPCPGYGRGMTGKEGTWKGYVYM